MHMFVFEDVRVFTQCHTRSVNVDKIGDYRGEFVFKQTMKQPKQNPKPLNA